MAVNNAVILAGGKGTRLLPITKTIPKPLVKVGGKSLLEWNIINLSKAGIKKIFIVPDYLKEKIVAEIKIIKKDYGIKGIKILSQNKKFIGDGSFYSAKKYLKINESFFCIGSDKAISASQAKSVIDAHMSIKNCLMTAGGLSKKEFIKANKKSINHYGFNIDEYFKNSFFNLMPMFYVYNYEMFNFLKKIDDVSENRIWKAQALMQQSNEKSRFSKVDIGKIIHIDYPEQLEKYNKDFDKIWKKILLN